MVRSGKTPLTILWDNVYFVVDFWSVCIEFGLELTDAFIPGDALSYIVIHRIESDHRINLQQYGIQMMLWKTPMFFILLLNGSEIIGVISMYQSTASYYCLYYSRSIVLILSSFMSSYLHSPYPSFLPSFPPSLLHHHFPPSWHYVVFPKSRSAIPFTLPPNQAIYQRHPLPIGPIR